MIIPELLFLRGCISAFLLLGLRTSGRVQGGDGVEEEG